MGKELMMNLLRSGLKVAGAALVAKGIGDAGAIEAVTGGIIAAVGIIWSMVVTVKKA